MDEEKGREQVFRLGVKFMNNVIDGEFREKFVSLIWNDKTKQEIIEFFKKKYSELKIVMPFLGIEEYPKIAIFEDSGKLKIHLQGWMHNCEKCWLLGGMWFNKKQFFDFYICRKSFEVDNLWNKEYFIIKYGDEPFQRYLKKVMDNLNYSIKWRAINNLYRRIDDIISINPFEFIKRGKE